MCERNQTPSSSMRAQSREAEHLKAAAVGEDRPRPTHERWRPPASRTSSAPGRKYRWYVLPRMISAPSSSSSSGVIALTVPCVPTGMKTGVSTSPCGVYKRPRRAAVSASSLINSNRKAPEPTLLSHFSQGDMSAQMISIASPKLKKR